MATQSSITPKSEHSGFVKRFGYKVYRKKFLGSTYRIKSLIYFNLRERLWNQRSVIIALAILIFIALIVLIPLGIFASYLNTANLGENDEEIALLTLQNIFNPVTAFILLNPFTFILLGVLGGRIIAEDIEYGTSDNYIVRINRNYYFIGKLGAIWISYLVVMLIPTIFIYWFTSTQFKFPLTDIDNIALLIQAISYCIIASFFLASLMIMISASTDKKNYATLMFIVGLFGISQIIPVFVDLLTFDASLDFIFFMVDISSDQLYYFSTTDILLSLYFGLTGEIENITFGGPSFEFNLSLTEALGVALITSCLSLYYSFHRVRNFT
ncbi:MAG: hypothetical protein ACXAC7_03235 [Candidatus Hodarchaeales archaeon]